MRDSPRFAIILACTFVSSILTVPWCAAQGRIDALGPQQFHEAVAGLADGRIVPRPQEASAGVHHRPMTVGEYQEHSQLRLIKEDEAPASNEAGKPRKKEL